MILIAIAMLQAAAPMASGAAAEPTAAPAAQPADDAELAAPAKPKMKRVCRTEMDPRVGTLASRHRVCQFVPADKDESPPK
jgi:hypothetical protein